MISKRDRAVMQNLKTLAFGIEPVKSARITACIVEKRNIISYGFCQRKSHTFQAKYGKHEKAIYFHAETHAIFNAIKLIGCDRLSKCTLYVYRGKKSKRDSKFLIDSISKPCEGCRRAIKEYKIARVVYINEQGKVEEW